MQPQSYLILGNSHQGQRTIESISTGAAKLFDESPSTFKNQTLEALSRANEKLRFFAEQLNLNSGSFSISKNKKGFLDDISIERIFAEDNREIILFKKKENPEKRGLTLQFEVFEKVFHKTMDAFLILCNNKIVYCNPSTVQRMNALFSEDIIGKTLLDLSPKYQPCGTLSKKKAKLMMDTALSKGSHIFEWKCRKLNGQEFFAEVSLTGYSEMGEEYFLTIARDISEKKGKESAIHKGEKLIKTLTDNSEDIISLMDINFKNLFINTAIEKHLGYTVDEYKKLPIEKRIVAEDIEKILQFFSYHSSLTFNDAATLNFEKDLRYIHKNGSYIWGHTVMTTIMDESNNVIEILSITRNISERKQSELILRENEEKLRTLFELAVDGIIQCDKGGFITGVNKKFLEITFLSSDEVIGKHTSKLFEKYAMSKEPLRFDLLKAGQTIVLEREFRRKDNLIIVVEIHTKRMPNGTFQTFFRDITDRKQSENQMKEQKRYLETLINNLPGIVYRCKNDKSWSMEFISGKCKELTGYAGNDFINNKVRSFNSIIHPDFHEKVWDNWLFILEKKKKFSEEYIIIDSSGNEKWVYEQGSGVYNDKNELLALEGFILDIDDRKKAEDNLRQSQFNYKMLAGYNHLLSRAALMFAMADTVEELEQMILKYYKQLNDAVLAMLMLYNAETCELSIKQFSVDESLKNTIFNIVGESAFYNNIKINPQIEKELISKSIIKTSKIEDLNFCSFSNEIFYQIQQSALIHEILVSSIQTKNNLIGTISAFQQKESSVPEEVLKTYTQLAGFALIRKRTEIELIDAKNRAEQSDSMKSIFLANISHEVRTPMNAIIGFAELLGRPNINEAEILKYTSIITKAGEQLLGLIDDLIDLAKIESGQMKINYSEFDIIQLIRNLFDMMKLKFEQKGIDFSLNLNNKTNTYTVTSDPLRVKQIVTNMLENAYKFTHSGQVVLGLKTTDKMFQIFVKDTGIGISPSESEKIFERFVKLETESKNDIDGKGLGLSISRSLAEILGGQIHLESIVHKGSIFYVSLPSIPNSKNII